MKNNIAKLCEISKNQINIKGKTTEKLGVVGKEKAIACEVICSIINMIKTINYLFVTFFGIGSFRFAPGTITSLVTIVFLYSLFHIINLPSKIVLLILFIIFVYSFYAVSEYIKFKENKDPKEVVIDEFIGQSIPIYLYEMLTRDV